MDDVLSGREKTILHFLVDEYIDRAEPIGSRAISQTGSLGVSPATIRNSMADLEEKGYVRQPHTSAGRIPTDKGYRCYVDHLMGDGILTSTEKSLISQAVRSHIREGDIENILEQVSKAIADVSKQLGIALAPRFENGVLEKVELVSFTTYKLLLVLKVVSGPIKTVIVELDSRISSDELLETAGILNDRLSGLSIGEIRRSIKDRFKSVSRGNPKLIQIVVEEVNVLFNFVGLGRLYLDGTTNVFMQPEFSDSEKISDLMNLLEDRESVVYMLHKNTDEEGISITIGHENRAEGMEMCSMVTSSYVVGGNAGIIGLIGPTRMKYNRLTALVKYACELTSSLL